MACAFGGVAIPPSRLRPMLVRKKVYWFASAHLALSSRRSNSSPRGMPQPARKTSWMHGFSGPSDLGGQASKAKLGLGVYLGSRSRVLRKEGGRGE